MIGNFCFYFEIFDKLVIVLRIVCEGVREEKLKKFLLFRWAIIAGEGF